MEDSLYNSGLVALHSLFVGGFSLVALRLGKEAIGAWLALLAIFMNIFVLKQVTLFGLEVTCSDALSVGYLLSLNLAQEFFGRQFARRMVITTLLITVASLALAVIHLAYLPNSYDESQNHFAFLFQPMPRLIFASLLSFFIVQAFDMTLFSFLQKLTKGRFLAPRTMLTLCFSETLDTLLYSFLGLYDLVGNLPNVILFSLIVKGAVIGLSAPFVFLSKRWVRHESVSI